MFLQQKLASGVKNLGFLLCVERRPRGPQEAPKRPSRGTQDERLPRGPQEAPKRPLTSIFYECLARFATFYFWRTSRAFLVLLLKPSKPRETFAKTNKANRKTDKQQSFRACKSLSQHSTKTLKTLETFANFDPGPSRQPSQPTI